MPNNDQIKQLGILEVTKIVEHKDGSATYHFSYDSRFEETIKEYLQINKKPTRKQASEFIDGIIKESIKGFKVKKEKKNKNRVK